MRAVIWGFWLAVGGVLWTAGTARAQPAMVAPCGLMSQTVAAGINGAPVLAGQEQDLPGPSKQCEFEGDGNGGEVSVAVSALTMGGMTTAQVFAMGEMTAPPAGTTVTKLSGLGDGAYFQSTSTSFDVWVLKGQVMLDVSATPTQAQMGNAGLEGLMVAAARTAVKGM